MNVVCIIQARTGSSRLPKKVLMDIEGKPMLIHVIERVLLSKNINKVVIATTTKAQDDAIVELIDDYNKSDKVAWFRGSEEDVLDRYYGAAKENNADIVVRITSDCPLIDPEVLDKVIVAFKNASDCDYCSNVIVDRTYPRGLDTEVFSFSILEHMWKNCKEKPEREHVTWHVVKNPDKFKIVPVTNKTDYSKHRWTVDVEEDLELVKKIYARLYSKKPNFNMDDILALFEEDPDLFNINAEIEQKKIQ